MPKYIATKPIKCDGDHFGAGDDVELKKEDAAPLLKSGTIVTPARWKEMQMPAAAQATVEAIEERAAALARENERLEKEVDDLTRKVAELAKAADAKKTDDKSGDNESGGGV